MTDRTPRPNQRLRHQRKLRGWTLEDVADGLHRLAEDDRELGVTEHMVGRWERGVRRASPRYVALLARLFELPADELGLVDDVPAAWHPAVSPPSCAPGMTMTVAGCCGHSAVEAGSSSRPGPSSAQPEGQRD